MKIIDVKVIRGDCKDFQEKLLNLLNQGYEIDKNIVIDTDAFLYAVLTKKLKEEKE